LLACHKFIFKEEEETPNPLSNHPHVSRADRGRSCLRVLDCATFGYTLLDDADYRAWRGYQWGQDQGYICADFLLVGMKKPRRFYLHRLIARPAPGQQVHHKNRCRWDNRRENLECVSLEEHLQRHPNSKRLAEAVRRRGKETATWLEEQQFLSLLREGEPVEHALP
jgi:hypothetical protein